MELYKEKLITWQQRLLNWKSNGSWTDGEDDRATVSVLRAYLPANLVAEAESRIEAQKKGQR